MTLRDVKVLIGEIDGTELQYQTEHVLSANEVKFNNTGFLWTEAEEVQEAIVDSHSDAVSKPRFPIACIMNGTMSNGDFIRYSNLSASANLKMPIACEITEVTYSNSNSASFDIVFYKNQTTTPFRTYEIRNSLAGVITGFSQEFAQGDDLYMKYVDRGTNASDLNVVAYMRAI